ncbi:MAG: carbohydrate ABC transporter permease [Chloroflexi bacterium]|nr:carbohydrate ABC transporter permease [Chloroflexota bacterium]
MLRRILFWLALALVIFYFAFPLYWIVISSFKTIADVTRATPAMLPFVDFQQTLANYSSILLGTNIESETGVQAAASLGEFRERLLNSVIISGISTALAVGMGTLAAYAFSRFRIPGEGDLLFFILSTRMLPPVVVLIPIFLFFSNLGLRDSYLGLIILYTSANVPFVVWMMKGFFDEIPLEYEEAAMVDGYSRIEAVWKIVIPEAIPAMAATAVFSAIVAWNEFVLSNLLNRNYASTVPPYLNSIVGVGQVEWGRLAAAAVLFVIPIIVFTFLVRNHLLRGVTFGAVRR